MKLHLHISLVTTFYLGMTIVESLRSVDILPKSWYQELIEGSGKVRGWFMLK